jgi:signal transduction histidine kinase
MSTRTKAIVPVSMLIGAILLSIYYNLVYPLRSFEYDILAFYAFISVMAFTLLVVFQRFVDIPRIHVPLSIGWGMVFLSGIEKFNAEYLDTIDPIWWVGMSEDLSTGVLGIGVGISVLGFYFWMAQNRQQEQLRDQQHQMIELYTSLMSHDAGNDLQAILGYIEAALLVPDGCSPKTLELLEAAKASALRMTSLIKAFKPEVEETESRLVSILEISALQAEKAHIGLSINISANEDTKEIEVVGGSMLQMAFANIFRNAAEYAGPEPKVSIEIMRNESNAIIKLTDSGPGIQQDIRNSIFDRGGVREGHGFGLYLTRQIISACNGTIELLESDSGAKFRIIIPF